MTEKELEKVARETAVAIRGREYFNAPDADDEEVKDIILSALKQVNKPKVQTCGCKVVDGVLVKCGEDNCFFSASPQKSCPQGELENDNPIATALFLIGEAADEIHVVAPNSFAIMSLDRAREILDSASTNVENEETGPAPCPFCGGTKVDIQWEPCPPLDKTDTNRRWFAECGRCACQGPFCQKEPQVIPAWNRRVPRPASSPDSESVDVAERTDKGCGPYMSDV